MPTISMFRGIKIYMNWREHQPQPVRQYSKEAEETAWIGVVIGLATPVIIVFILYRLIFR